IRENRVFADPQLEHLLQQRHAFAYRTRAGKGPEVSMWLLQLSTVKAKLRIFFRGDADIGIALVIPEHHVVARLMRLDQVVLEQERFARGTRDRGLDPGNLRD